MKHSGSILVLSLVLATSPPTARKQSAGPPPATQGNFTRRFPNPSGTNGYEEFVMAGDLLLASAAWQAYESEDAVEPHTLADQRKVDSDPAVKHALALVRAGLDKPVIWPRDGVAENAIPPERHSFRALADLLNVHMYVLLADGRVGEAIDGLRDAFRFVYKIQTADSRAIGLWSIIMDNRFVSAFAGHLGQLSARDCDRLLAVVREWIAQPDPTLPLLAAMRDDLLRLLEKGRSQPDDLLQAYAPGENSGELRTSYEETRKALADPTAGTIFDEAAGKVTAYYARAMAEMQKPVWERADPWPAGDAPTAADHLLRLLTRTPARTMARYAADVAQVQLLGVHAAIRRYLWEHDRLPAGLDDLHLRSLALDPFSGTPLTYRRLDDRTYTLSSIGPTDTRASGTPDSGRRTPIELPYSLP